MLLLLVLLLLLLFYYCIILLLRIAQSVPLEIALESCTSLQSLVSPGISLNMKLGQIHLTNASILTWKLL